MKEKLKNIIIALFITGFYAVNYAQDMIGTTYAMANLSTLNEHIGYTPQDGDMMYVRHFRYEGDGGGGLFVYRANSIVNPVELVQSSSASYSTYPFLQGYPYDSEDANEPLNGLFDGMVVVPRGQATTYRGDENNDPTPGRWIRLWNRGPLNLRWFGANCHSYHDNSPAINAALEYAQFEVTNSTPLEIFTDEAYTAPSKTIFIPSGTYYLKSPIEDIDYGVVFEGEGNMSNSYEQQGTELITQVEYDATYAPTQDHIFSANQYGIFRYIANEANNSGGGFKNVTITVESTGENHVPQNVITVYSPKVLPNAAVIDTTTGLVQRDENGVIVIDDTNAAETDLYNPSVSKWFAENLTVNMQGNALRGILMRSKQQGTSYAYRVRDPNIINCWFSGNTKVGESVTAINTSGLHIIGGGFTIPEDEIASGNIVSIPGVSLLVGKDYHDSNDDGVLDSNDELLDEAFGCSNTHLDGVDISNGIIKLGERSNFTNIDCPFGRLEIGVEFSTKTNSWPVTLRNGAHVGLQVNKLHTLNMRDFDDVTDPILSRLKCPSTSGTSGDNSTNVIYLGGTSSYIPDNEYIKCFNHRQEIETDTNAPTFDN